MSQSSLSPENISTLIDHVLRTEDPATVGLRRILKEKREAGQDFPFRRLDMPAFGGVDGRQRVLNEEEEHTLSLEKQLCDLRGRLDEQRAKAEKAIQRAYRKGVEEGVKRGEQEGERRAAERYEQQLAAVEERVAAMLRDAARSRTELLYNMQTALLELSLRVARKVIDTELKLDPQIVLAVIKKTLTHVADREGITVRVAPADLETVTGKKEFWTSVAERLEDIRIEADERIEPGGCVIESGAGVADARIGLMYEELRDLVERTWQEEVTAGLRDAAHRESHDPAAPLDEQQEAGEGEGSDRAAE